MFEFPVLIGDIGGTNARFALLQETDSNPAFTASTMVSGHQDICVAIDAIMVGKTPHRPKTIILAIAGPVDGDVIKLTNADWQFDPRILIAHFKLDCVVVMNDFSAQALAAISLGAKHLKSIGGGTIDPSQPKIVLGPGTGLGVATIINSDGKWIVLPGEGGHIDLGPRTDREFLIWSHMQHANGRVSAEMALSGSGLENLYEAICAANHKHGEKLTAAQITKAAENNPSGEARETVDLFVTLLARTAGDLALVIGAQGGVYLAGGIAGKLEKGLLEGNFRPSFEDKAPHNELLENISVQLITHPTAALEGMMAYARNPEQYRLNSAVVVRA